MAKNPLELQWIEDLLPDDFRRRHMFGGFVYYVGEKMMLASFETSGKRSYEGHTFDFEIWYGCMFPVAKEFHAKALQKFPVLRPHPVLMKWLYLPVETEGFDEHVTEILSEALRPQSFWGTIPNEKRSKSKKVLKEEKIPTKMDTRRPRMFSDEPAEEKLKTVKKISDFKNLGPTTESHFHKAGIKSAQQFIKMGWKKALQKLVASNPKTRHSLYAYALIGALKNQDWMQISEADKQEAKAFVKSLALSKKKVRRKK